MSENVNYRPVIPDIKTVKIQSLKDLNPSGHENITLLSWRAFFLHLSYNFFH